MKAAYNLSEITRKTKAFIVADARDFHAQTQNDIIVITVHGPSLYDAVHSGVPQQRSVS